MYWTDEAKKAALLAYLQGLEASSAQERAAIAHWIATLTKEQ